MNYQQYLRTSATTLELGEVLRATPDVLLGVGPDALHTLGQVGIGTVFDLARSATFGAADQVRLAATDPDSVEARTGELPADLFKTAPTGSLAQAPDQDVNTLRLVADAGLNGALSESLDVRTIRDLALWPPYQAAKAIVAEAAQTTPANAEGTPDDLLPASGRYPTERAYYSTFVLADLDDPTGDGATALEGAGALDLTNAVTGTGFTKPIRGARLTFGQSWYSQGVALGQLLHSLALAPGESTRVAMIDWSRQQTGTELQQAGQSEQLVGDLTHKRAMGEVQNAVAQQAAQGFSQTDSNSSQTQAGGSAGLGLGPLTIGGSGSYATNSTNATTLTGTSGVRDISAAMTQNIADATHQAASSARNMFASVVREVSQSEHENVSTRLVANFNHMHALTVQYYEVVQIYRTSIGLHSFEPCLFVPMKPIDFLAPASSGGQSPAAVIIRRYRQALYNAALDDHTRSLLAADASRTATVEIRPNVQRLLPSALTTKVSTPPVPPPSGTDTGTSTSSTPSSSTDKPSTSPASVSPTPDSVVQQVQTVDGSVIEVPQGATLQSIHATFPCKRAGLHFLPNSPENTAYLPVEQDVGNDGQPFNGTLGLPVPLGDLVAIDLDTSGLQQTGYVTLVLTYQGAPLQVDVPVVAYGLSTGFGDQVMTLRVADPTQTLQTRLAEDQLYYSQAVWQAMDSATISLLMAPFTYGGKPMAQVVDPTPVGVSGNYLIFRMPGEARDLLAAADQPATTQTAGAGAGKSAPADSDDAAWLDWVRRHAQYDVRVEDFVPLPSGGVFAEAVLGRSNSAEKLDITRFWNWQDSPIPLQAPQIAPVTTGSRATTDDLTPTGFAAPIVAFNNPPALPDPAGLSASLSALSNGALFSDASGSAITQALALASLTGAGTGATSAGSQASAAAALAAQKQIEMAKIAAGVLTGGLAGGLTGKAGSISEQGARINEGRSLDEQAAADPEGQAGTHETRAAEGESGKAIDLLGEIAGTPVAGAEEPAPSTSSSSSSSSPQPAENGKIEHGKGGKSTEPLA